MTTHEVTRRSFYSYPEPKGAPGGTFFTCLTNVAHAASQDGATVASVQAALDQTRQDQRKFYYDKPDDAWVTMDALTLQDFLQGLPVDAAPDDLVCIPDVEDDDEDDDDDDDEDDDDATMEDDDPEEED